MSELELEPESHTYTLRGTEIPGCTDVLTAMGAAPSFWFLTDAELEFYSSRGKAVHKMVELSIKGALDKRTMVKDIKPYLIGWERFVNDYNVEVVNAGTTADGNGDHRQGPFTEISLHHEAYRYGVTPDVVAKVKATSAFSAATELQTAAQLLAVEQALRVKLKGDRWAVRLMPQEPYYEPKHYTERGDASTWIGMLSAYNWLVRRAKMNPKRNHR